MKRARTPRKDSPPPQRLVARGAVVIIAVGLFIAAGVRVSNGVPGLGYRHLYVELPNIGNLRPHDEVRIAGVRIGQVLTSTPTGHGARVSLQLTPGTGALPDDTHAIVRARGLLGSRFLELDPGTSHTLLADGATLQVHGPSITSGVPDLLNTFDAKTRGGLSDTVGGLGQAVAGQGDGLNHTIAIAPGIAAQATRITKAVRARDPAAAALLPSLRSGIGALAAARNDIADGFQPTADALAPFADRRAATQATLDQAPPTLQAITADLPAGQQLLAATAHLSETVNRVLPSAPAGLHAATALLNASPPGLRATTDLLHGLRATVPDVLSITAHLAPNLVPLRRVFNDLDPLLASLGTYGCDVQNFAKNFRSSLGYGSVTTSEKDVDVGFLNQFRIAVLAGPGSISGIAPSSKEFTTDRNAYVPPCTNAGPKTYTTLPLDALGAGR
jgi:phospholipid/cholesterol/gamma-HCH transport system substrate-binding protein